MTELEELTSFFDKAAIPEEPFYLTDFIQIVNCKQFIYSHLYNIEHTDNHSNSLYLLTILKAKFQHDRKK